MPRLLALIVTAALALGVAGSASALNQRGGNRTVGPTSFIVTGTWDTTYTYGVNGKRRTCTLTRGAKCVGAKLRGKVKHHGDLRKVNLRRADLRFADLRGANLSGADLRSANLRHADLRGANLKGAKLQYARPVHGFGRRANATTPPAPPACYPSCIGADLEYVNASGANLTGAHLGLANLSYANFTGATLKDAYVWFATVNFTNFSSANLQGLQGWILFASQDQFSSGPFSQPVMNGQTVCPDGSAARYIDFAIPGAGYMYICNWDMVMGQEPWSVV